MNSRDLVAIILAGALVSTMISVVIGTVITGRSLGSPGAEVLNTILGGIIVALSNFITGERK